MSRVNAILKNREWFHVLPDQTVADVARRMTELNVGAIAVTDGGRLCGIFSERDLMRRVVLGSLDPAATPVSAVMTVDVFTIDDDATVEQAMEKMHNHGCRHLPVVRTGELVGFLSMRDLMDFELASKTDELHHMRAYIHGAA